MSRPACSGRHSESEGAAAMDTDATGLGPTVGPAQASEHGEVTTRGGHAVTSVVRADGMAEAGHVCCCLLGYAQAADSETMHVDDDAGARS